VARAYWSASDKINFTGRCHTCWRLCGEAPDETTPITLFFSTNGKAVGIRADGSRLFGFATPEAASTNDFHTDYFVYAFAADNHPFTYEAVKTNGVLETEDWTVIGESLRYAPL